MKVELTRYRVKEGKTSKVMEWLDFLTLTWKMYS